MKIKTKINKWDLIKLKSCCTTKETINQTKRQPMEWEKIFLKDTIENGLISKIYERLIQLNIKTTNNKKMGRSKCKDQRPKCTARQNTQRKT